MLQLENSEACLKNSFYVTLFTNGILLSMPKHKIITVTALGM
jgi:hypothetical protein